MKVLVTGADGFIGRALVARLLAEPAKAVTRVTLLDQHVAAPPVDPRVCVVAGDIADAEVLQRALEGRVDLVFHLAAVAGGLAELQFELGKRVNLDATLALLEQLRRQPKPARMVFASSIGVYGAALRSLVDESTVPSPTLSYGAQKLIGEILITDYSRRGFIDGRSVRVPVIVARPSQAASVKTGFMSDLIRDLSAGRTFTCPVPAESVVWWLSRACLVDNLLHAAALPTAAADAQTVWQLPALHLSMAEVVAGIAHIHGEDVQHRVSYRDDPDLRAQFANFPPLHCPRSVEAGFRHDGTVENLVRRALDGPP
jgi:nucleoside-diphosphate-sugar epimerase